MLQRVGVWVRARMCVFEKTEITMKRCTVFCDNNKLFFVVFILTLVITFMQTVNRCAANFFGILVCRKVKNVENHYSKFCFGENFKLEK